MSEHLPHTFTSFDGHRRISAGSLKTNALMVKTALEAGAAGPVLLFDDQTGRSIDVDMRGSMEEVATRLDRFESAQSASTSNPESANVDEPRGRGRPKLGVVPREVTLLPRHWEWLATQPGGASVALRKLVEEARRGSGDKDNARKAQERAYHFMTAIAGDLPGFEEATRALFANDKPGFAELLKTWPDDVREHAMLLAFGVTSGSGAE